MAPNVRETEDPQASLRKVIERRNYRDLISLRKTRIDYMTILATNYRDWFYAEIKDLLLVTGILGGMVNHKTVLDRLQIIEKRVRAIERSYPRKVISPINTLARRKSRAQGEEDHHDKCKGAQDNAWRLVVELRGYRYELDVMIGNALGTPLQMSPDAPPQMYR